MIIGCLFSPLIPLVVKAIDPPTSSPSVEINPRIHVNRNLVATGDACIFGIYKIPYTSIPAVNANKTYIFRLMDTDNTTQKGAVLPFVFFDSGYNYGGFGFYFSTNITWGTQYIIRISQNPAYFAIPESYDYVMAATDYSDETAQDDNQAEMASNILLIATYLEQQYPTYTLVGSGVDNTVLAAPQGETYFRGIIPGLQQMAPSLFLVSTQPMDYTSTNWTLTQANIYEQRNAATWVGAAENATATQFGMTRQTILSAVLIVPGCLAFLLVSTVKYKKSLVGLLVSSVLVIMGYIMGWLPPAIFATIYQLMGIYTSYVWFLARG